MLLVRTATTPRWRRGRTVAYPSKEAWEFPGKERRMRGSGRRHSCREGVEQATAADAFSSLEALERNEQDAF